MARFPLRTWVPDFSKAEPHMMRETTEQSYGKVVYLSFLMPDGQVVELPFHGYRVDKDGKENPHGDYVELKAHTYKHWKQGYTDGEAISVITSLWMSPKGHKVETVKDDDGDCVWAVRFNLMHFLPKEEEPADYVLSVSTMHDITNGEPTPSAIFTVRARSEAQAISSVWTAIKDTHFNDYFTLDAFSSSFGVRNNIIKTGKIIRLFEGGLSQ